jgi:HD superfamily phosphodiesterase
MRLFVSNLFNFVLLSTKKIGIDESHGISHSMNVLQYSKKIYESEIKNTPRLIHDEKIIYASAILHDMCDNKYTDEISGSSDIVNYLQKQDVTNEEIDTIQKIITTMSYSKVKKQGYPELGKFQKAYHIVREADLLTAYDFDRAMIYNIHKKNSSIHEAFEDSNKLFIKRVFQYINDGLFVNEYSKKEAMILHSQAIKRIESWKKTLEY